MLVCTAGSGERYWACSLPFEQFASWLHNFHFGALEPGATGSVTSEEIVRVTAYIYRTWGADRRTEL